jgi:hypothetical protein
MPDEDKGKRNPLFGNKDLINLGLSAVDPEAAKLAAKLARGAPPWLRTPLAERITALLKSVLESYTSTKGPVVGALGEKLTDYLDFARDELYGGLKAAEKVGLITTTAWMDRFLVNAEKRLNEATDPEAERERLEKEFEARKRVVELVEAAAKAVREEAEAATPEPPTPPEPIDWGARWQGLKKRLYGTERKPGPVPKATRAVAETLGGVNDALEGWLTRKEV